MGWSRTPSPGFKWRPKLKIWTDGQNNTFDPETFEGRSYRHWLYVAKIKGKVVFNDYYYSSQTRNHRLNMRALLKQLKIKIDVVISTRADFDELSSGIREKYSDLFECEISLEHTRTRTDDLTSEIEEIKSEIKAMRQLGCKFSKAAQKALKNEMILADKARREYERSQAKAEREERKARVLAVKPELTDMSEVKFVFESFDDLEEIDLNNLGVKNV